MNRKKIFSLLLFISCNAGIASHKNNQNPDTALPPYKKYTLPDGSIVYIKKDYEFFVANPYRSENTYTKFKFLTAWFDLRTARLKRKDRNPSTLQDID